MPQHRKILWSMATADATAIFAKGHVEHPMHTVFDPPVPTNRTRKAARGWGTAQQVIAGFLAGLSRYAARVVMGDVLPFISRHVAKGVGDVGMQLLLIILHRQHIRA